MTNKLIIAIDGPSGAGKSTVAKRLATELGYIYIDTGAMYRAIGWKAHKTGVQPIEGEPLQRLCDTTGVELRQSDDGVKIFVDGEDVSASIRTSEMGMMASAVSAQPCVRARLLELQRDMGRRGGVVMDGRDIGTVVFPDAQAKFYLDADVAIRAARRHEELSAKGSDTSYNTILDDVIKRDYNDTTREIAPLCKAPDAVVVDSTGMTIQEVVSLMKNKVDEIVSGL